MQVLQETLMMIPDCHRRIVTALAELKGLLETEVPTQSYTILHDPTQSFTAYPHKENL